MSDIALTLNDDLLGDLIVVGNDLAVDDGLETAVIVSLFTDARAKVDDVIPDGSGDPRGWWADSIDNDDGDQTGSRLWLLDREKQTTKVLQRARQYAQEALQWMLDDQVVSEVNVDAEIVRDGWLGISVELVRPKGDAVQYRYEYAWRQQAARRA